MFLFKKIVAPLLFPLPVCLLMLAGGLALLWFTRRQRAGKILATTGFTLLVLLSYGWLSDPLLSSLERYHEPLAAAPAGADITWVVVLGGGTSSDARLPPAGRLSEASLARLVEGVRLHRQLPGSRLLLSGGSVFGSGSDAEAMLALATALGVAAENVTSEAVSLDTENQARNIREIVKGDRFILVTSASHMRRSVALFKKEGMDPIPAPTHYLSHKSRGLGPASLYPGSGGLRKAEAAAYEYLGLAWARLRGRI